MKRFTEKTHSLARGGASEALASGTVRSGTRKHEVKTIHETRYVMYL